MISFIQINDDIVWDVERWASPTCHPFPSFTLPFGEYGNILEKKTFGFHKTIIRILKHIETHSVILGYSILLLKDRVHQKAMPNFRKLCSVLEIGKVWRRGFAGLVWHNY